MNKPFLVIFHLPQVLHNFVHRPPVGELHLKGDGLPGHLDVDEDVKERRHNLKPKVQFTQAIIKLTKSLSRRDLKKQDILIAPPGCLKLKCKHWLSNACHNSSEQGILTRGEGSVQLTSLY
jgi:hypothetical protein